MSMLLVTRVREKAAPTANDAPTAIIREVPTPIVTDVTRLEVELKMSLAMAEALALLLAQVAPSEQELLSVNNHYLYYKKLAEALSSQGIRWGRPIRADGREYALQAIDGILRTFNLTPESFARLATTTPKVHRD